jgi:signal transduction histidine kinase/pSer/pThr/pTyr-binding forkhead associated (FHA) protein
LQIIQGPEKGQSFALAEGENIIGRKGRGVVVSDGTVSRRHARLALANDHWLLSDLGSANGTYLNGVRLKEPTVVNRGDQIRCGSTLLVFMGGAAGPQAAVDIDEEGNLVDAAIVATMPSSEDSVIIPTPEAGARAIGNLRILYDLIAEVGSILNIDVLLRRTLDKVFEVVKADRGYIMLIDEHGRLDLRAAKVADEPPPRRSSRHQARRASPDGKAPTAPAREAERRAPISRTIVNEVVSKQVGVLSSNAMSDKRFAAGKSVHDFGIRSAMCVPIKGRERILGVIHVDCSVSEHTYSTEQLRLLTAVGYQTGLAIENVRLYEATVQSERLAAVGETVAVLSHHIKNILQALGAGADVVEMGLKADDLAKAKESWPIVQRNLARINTLILNMLAFSREREPQLESLNVNRILGECIELESSRADERGIALLSDLDDLPPIPADDAGLHQAFLNLISNGVDAVEDNDGVVTVSSRYDSMNREVTVTVADNGSGIEPDSLPKIFNPFFSAKGQGGTGLGLAVAKKVVEEHQGRISVQSTVGEGTTFVVALPALPPESADAGDTDNAKR